MLEERTFYAMPAPLPDPMKSTDASRAESPLLKVTMSCYVGLPAVLSSQVHSDFSW